jgi:pSer/pThr/pTyr-binding forkhead associated (FHA) protein
MASTPEPIRGRHPGYAPGVQLTLSLKGQRVQTYRFDKPEITVGRDPYCDVFVDNPGVSRQHFKINYGDTGEFRVTDSGSSNGTYLNDRPVKVGTLRDGDILQFGKYSMLVNIDELVGGEDNNPRKHDAAEGATMMLSPSEVRQMVSEARGTPGQPPRLTVVPPARAQAPPEPAASSGIPAWALWVAVGAVAVAVVAYLVLMNH